LTLKSIRRIQTSNIVVVDAMSDLIAEIFERARVKNVPIARLADKAGVRPETLSRLKHRDNYDMKTLHCLALAVGCRLALVPIDQDGGYAVYSPRDNARAKVESRRRDEEMVASGLVSREDVQRRNGFFSLPHANFPIKGLGPEER